MLNFKIERAFCLTGRKPVIAGEIIEGKLTVGESLCVKFKDGTTSNLIINRLEKFRNPSIAEAFAGTKVGIEFVEDINLEKLKQIIEIKNI